MSKILLYTNYEEAQNAYDGNDLFIIRVLSAIEGAMLENANARLKPEFPFDMRYFYGAVVRSVADAYDYQIDTSNFTGGAITAVNVPRFNNPEWQNLHIAKTGLAWKFVERVQQESASSGSRFDSTFACGIAEAAFDERALRFVKGGMGKVFNPSENDFNNWLGGFFASDES